MRRLHAGEVIAGLGGALLLICLLLPWYRGGTAVIFGLGTARLDDSFSAWQTFTVVDVLFALAAVMAIALLLATASRRAPAIVVALSALVALAGLALSVLVVVRALSPPAFELVQAGRSATSVIAFEGSDPAIGLWLGLAGCAGMLVGGCVAMGEPGAVARSAAGAAARR